MEKYKHEAITGKIIGSAMRVHSFLGSGFREVIYQRALAIELQREGMVFKREVEMPIYYRDHPEPIGKRRVDFMVENVVFVETKAKTQLTNEDVAQTINYLEAHRVVDVALLINFGEKSLRWRRFVN